MDSAIRHPRDDFIAGGPVETRRIDPRFVAVAGAIAVFAAATTVGAPRTLEAYRAERSEPAPEAATTLEPAELPAEWRWKRKTVSFDPMYRQQ